MRRIKSIAIWFVAISFMSAVLALPTVSPSGKADPQLKPDTQLKPAPQLKPARGVVRDPSFVPTSKNFGIPVPISKLSGFKKGILDCGTGGLNCSVRNMPLLWQTDPRIDKDVQDMGDAGCYNTSIVTVILTALANRNKSVAQPKNRTKFFEEIPAGVGGNGQSVPKEIKQLSQAYRWQKQEEKGVLQGGKPVQTHYFHEVIADLGPIKEACNPYVYGDCADASNPIGHAFRKFISDSPENINNEYVINLMNSGYVVMIAYARYDPLAVLDGDGYGKPSTKVSFKFNSFHKVVFSGFQPGKYPLLINDVGNGKQYRVRLSTDFSERTFSTIGLSGKPGLSNFKLSFHYPTKTKIFLEYEGPKGVNGQVFFIEHIDGLKIALSNPRQ